MSLPILVASCDVCDMAFTQLSSWTSHKELHTKDDNSSKHRCDICNKTYTQKVGLLNHKRRHVESEKTHTCQVCPLKFYTTGM